MIGKGTTLVNPGIVLVALPHFSVLPCRARRKNCFLNKTCWSGWGNDGSVVLPRRDYSLLSLLVIIRRRAVKLEVTGGDRSCLSVVVHK